MAAAGASAMRDPHHKMRPHERARAEPRRAEHTLIFGIHAVEAALANSRRIVRKLHLTDNAERRLHATLGARQLAPERVLPKDLDRRLGSDTVHQGALLETEPL